MSDFWTVAAPGDTLCLADGTYTGDSSMIAPPAGLAGAEGAPITIAARHDGKVWIDGETERGPVSIEDNHWLVLEGFDACCARSTMGSYENSVVFIRLSDHITVRRVVAWDAADGNTVIFGSDAIAV